jgi:hypothetical protein
MGTPRPHYPSGTAAVHEALKCSCPDGTRQRYSKA